VKRTNLALIVVNAQADALAVLCKDGFIDIFDGEMPNDPETAVTRQVRCVSLKLGSPAFLPAEKGVIAANPIGSGVSEADVKQASWARVYRADHKTAVMDVTVGTRDANLILPTTHIVRNVTVSCASFLHSVARASAGQ
jgi:hypothetical protein